MSTDNEIWREDTIDGNRDASRDGNNAYSKDGHNRRDDYNRSSFNRDNNYNRDGYQNQNRPSYGDRPQRPSYNRYGNDRPNYNREDRPQRQYDRDGDRPQRQYDRDSGNTYRREGDERQYNRPRFNRPDGERTYNRTDRPQQQPYNNNRENRPWRSNNEGSQERPRFRKPATEGYENTSYNNGYDRPRRPRIQTGGDNRYQGGDNRYQGGDNRYQGGDNRYHGGDNRYQGGHRQVRRTSDYNPNAKYSVKKQIEYKEQFVDPNEPIRLNKFLSNAGVCSRREADEFITAGVVSVNGEVVNELGTKIKRTDLVKFHEQPVSIERKIYILLNKPKDCVTTMDDPQSRRTVIDLVKDACHERIYPVGRLDRNTTGVLLLTNDGDLASKLTHPKYLKKKIYQVVTDKNVTKHDMEQILAGVKLDEETEIKADSINYTDEVKRDHIGIEIHSGQNRIVRRIFETLGYKVIRLDRVFFAGLTKKGLKRGDWRYLTERELNFLKMGSFT